VTAHHERSVCFGGIKMLWTHVRSRVGGWMGGSQAMAGGCRHGASLEHVHSPLMLRPPRHPPTQLAYNAPTELAPGADGHQRHLNGLAGFDRAFIEEFLNACVVRANLAALKPNEKPPLTPIRVERAFEQCQVWLRCIEEGGACWIKQHRGGLGVGCNARCVWSGAALPGCAPHPPISPSSPPLPSSLPPCRWTCWTWARVGTPSTAMCCSTWSCSPATCGCAPSSARTPCPLCARWVPAGAAL
jgi:hypothetical protein